MPAEESSAILRGILQSAKVEDPQAVLKLLSNAGVTASDLLAERSDQNAEAMLQRAGLLLGDCVKIVRALRSGSSSSPGRGHGSGSSASLPSSSGGGCCSCVLRAVCAPCIALHRCLLSRSPFKPSMKCGLIMYSTTVLIVSLTVLSFYLPAMLYQSRTNHRRIGTHFLQPTQANFLMPSANGHRAGGGGGGGRSSSGHRQVMMVTGARASVLLLLCSPPLLSSSALLLCSPPLCSALLCSALLCSAPPPPPPPPRTSHICVFIASIRPPHYSYCPLHCVHISRGSQPALAVHHTARRLDHGASAAQQAHVRHAARL